MKKFVFKIGDEEALALTEEECLRYDASFGEILSAVSTLFDGKITSISIEECEVEHEQTAKEET